MHPSYTSTPSRPKNLVQVLERAAMIMEILRQVPSGLRVGEIAAWANLRKGTVSLDYTRTGLQMVS